MNAEPDFEPIYERLPLDSLTPYPNNARTHSDEQVQEIARSIAEFGFNNPILIDESLNIIAGHGRYRAAQALNLDEVPCLMLKHLSDSQRKAYLIADNRLALNADWDFQMLAQEMHELNAEGLDLQVLGFSASEMDAIERMWVNGAEPPAPENTALGDDRYLLQLEFDTERELQQEFERAQEAGITCKVLT